MEMFYLKSEAKFFCVLVLAFLFVFRRRNFKNQSKENNLLYFFSLVSIFFSVMADFIQNEILQTTCFAVCGISCFVAAYFCCEQFVNIREFKATRLVKTCYILGCVMFGLLSFVLLNSGIGATLLVLIFAAVVLLVVEQDNKIKVDNLTKLYNRYGMDVELKEQLHQYRLKNEDSFYMIACDLDNFKHINDTWGHQEGDRALTLVAGVLARVGKKFDSAVFRIGGDEFVIITDKSPEGLDVEITNAIKTELDSLDFRDDFDIRMSIGTALYDGITPIDELLNKADKKLYEAKKEKPIVIERRKL